MAPSAIERKIRSRFPLIRLMQAYLPLSISNWLINLGVKHIQLASGVTIDDVLADGVPCKWVTPQNSPGDKVLLYFHGGGFVYGLTPQHIEMVAYLAQKMGTRALMVDYRLGPAHPFPAALDDCVTAFRWLLNKGISAQHIVVAGDSAGGNLTITTMMKLRDSREQLPTAAVCLSPVVDFSDRGLPATGIDDPMLPPRAMKIYNTAYTAHNDPNNPLISPALGDWHALPPLLIHAGEDEILCADAVKAEGLARAAGVDVRLEIYPRMWHVWQIFLALPQARQSLDDIAQFLKSHLEECG